MNLLEKYVNFQGNEDFNNDPNIIEFKYFKKYQFSQIKYFVELAVNYISTLCNNNMEIVETNIDQTCKYLDIYGYSVLKVECNIKQKDSDEIKECLSFYIPELIEDNFFYLSGVTYAPCVYIIDKPITVKEKSIKLFSLFSPITVFSKDKRVIFIGRNIPLHFFINWFIKDKDLINQFYEYYNIDLMKSDEKEITDYFLKFFNCKSVDEINNSFDKVFLDEYTKKIYSLCYGMDINTITTQSIIEKSIRNSIDPSTKKSFIDLSDKRIAFIELILRPIFKKCGELIPNILRGFPIDKISIQSDAIKKNFFKDLKGNYTYDLVNFYSGIITHKASMVPPGIDNPPNEVSSMHSSHYGRICPVTITPKDPGRSVGIVPGLMIHKDGLFINEKTHEILR